MPTEPPPPQFPFRDNSSDDFRFNLEDDEYTIKSFKIKEKNFLFNTDLKALTGCPPTSSSWDITISFDGCCMHDVTESPGLPGSLQFTTIGDGIVSVYSTYSGAAFGGKCDEILTVTINGSNTYSSYIPDCTFVTVTWSLSTNTGCCYSDYDSMASTLLPSCEGVSYIRRRRNITTGIEKTYLNKNSIIKKIMKKRLR